MFQGFVEYRHLHQVYSTFLNTWLNSGYSYTKGHSLSQITEIWLQKITANLRTIYLFLISVHLSTEGENAPLEMASYTIISLPRALIKTLQMSKRLFVLKKPLNHTQTQESKTAHKLFKGYAIKIEGFLNWIASAPW